MMDLNTY